MNKKVQNYLETNENQTLSRIKAFIIKNKDEATKVVTLGLTTAAVLTLLASCNPQKTPEVTNDDPTTTTNQIITDNPDVTTDYDFTTETPVTTDLVTTTDTPVTTEPIVNVTAEEILAKLNDIASGIIKEQLEPAKEQFGEHYNSLNYSFSSISNDVDPTSTEYVEDKPIMPYSIKKNNRTLYNPDTKEKNTIGDYYTVALTIKFSMPIVNGTLRVDDICVPAELYEKLASIYNLSPTLVDNSKIHDSGYSFMSGQGYIIEHMPKITTSKIKNYNQEQLNILNEFVDTIIYTMDNYKFPDKYMDNELTK